MLTPSTRDMSQTIFDPADFPKGDDRPLEELYRGLYQPYMAWAIKRWQASDEVFEDAFNQAVLIFRRKAWEGSLDGYIGKQLNTILFSFCANLVRNRLKTDAQHQERFRPLLPQQVAMEEECEEMVHVEAGKGIFREAAEGRAALLQQGFAQLTKRCQQLLLLRIVQGLSMADIALRMGLSGENSAKTAKNKCQNRLKQLVEQQK